MPVPEFLSGSKTLNTPLPSYSSKDPRKRRLSEPPNDRYFLMFFSPLFFQKSRLYTSFIVFAILLYNYVEKLQYSHGGIYV